MKHKFTLEIADQIKSIFDGAEVKALVEATEKAADNTSGTFEVVITTEHLDRYNEVIKLDGWELENYKKNAVVLWGHDHHLLPIGVCTSLTITDGKMIAKGKFATHEHAQEIRKLYDLGIVKATSVGFIEKEREGNLITKAELIEFSFVSVPANPHALSLAMEKELNINELVTRGFLDIKTKDAEEEETEEEKPPEEATPAEPAPDDTETLAKAVGDYLIKTLNLKTIALEAPVETPEPERKEAEEEVEEEADETEEEKALRKFTEGKKVLQDTVTLVGETLAYIRQAREQGITK
jgi:HK97 family phage prohead protease